MNVTLETALRWRIQGMTVLLVLVAAYAVTLYLQVDELQASVSKSEKAAQDAAAAGTKVQAQLKAANAKVGALEQAQRESDVLKTLLGKLEPQIVPALEAAGKTGKPDARAAAITGVGLIGQIAHGVSYDAAIGALTRARAIDKTSCIAGLAINLGAVGTAEVTPDCQGLLPAAATAAEPKPAVAPAATPAGSDAKGAPAPAKG